MEAFEDGVGVGGFPLEDFAGVLEEVVDFDFDVGDEFDGELVLKIKHIDNNDGKIKSHIKLDIEY